MHKKSILLVLIGMLLAIPARSQDNAKPAPMRSMPKVRITPDLQLVLDLAGDWETSEAWEKNEFTPGGEGTGKQSVRLGPGGYSVIIDYESKSGPYPDYRAHGVLSWEYEEKIYRMVWAQNVMPGISLETGRMEGADLVTSYEINEHGQKYTVLNVYSDRMPKSYTLTSYYVDKQGNKIKNVTIKYRKP